MFGSSPSESLPFFHPAALISTCFGVGYLPFAPGTWGSLLALPLAWVILSQWSQYILLVVTFVLFLAGMLASNIHQKRREDKDPSYIVIDEFVGQLLVLSIAPLGWVYFFAAFLLFRIFDICKPWPISWADKTIRNGFGIMFDDILAAGYTAAIFSFLLFLIN
ncbi:MAG: phosphatidylglycerophosphatase A [Rhodospirillaceae bacterium]|nr:phosphatidylglycerophosphatase A [Rhodospirillaceae bacterium]|tara:strand:- start:1166 stop:1654 length:489 start_codon:yes stop_codon:yes gene_type:complete